MQRVLPNGITIYDDGAGSADLFEQVVMEFDIWRDKGFAKIPEELRMPILYKDGWEDIVDKSGKVYTASARDRKLVVNLMRVLYILRYKPNPSIKS